MRRNKGLFVVLCAAAVLVGGVGATLFTPGRDAAAVREQSDLVVRRATAAVREQTDLVVGRAAAAVREPAELATEGETERAAGQELNLLALQGFRNTLSKTSVNAGEEMDSVFYRDGALVIEEMKVDTGVFALNNAVLTANRYTTADGRTCAGEELTRTARAAVTVTGVNGGSSWYGLGLYFGMADGDAVFARIEQGGFVSCYVGTAYKTGASLPAAFQKNHAYELAVQISGRRAEVSLDGVKLFAMNAAAPIVPGFGIVSCGATGKLERLSLSFAEEIVPPAPNYTVDALGEGVLAADRATYQGGVFAVNGGREEAVFATLCGGLEQVWRRAEGGYEQASGASVSAKATMAVEFDSGTEQLGILLRDGLELVLKRDGVTVLEEDAAVASFPLSAEDGSFLVTALSDGASLTLTVNGALLCYGREIKEHVNRFGFRTDGGDAMVYGISYRYAEEVYAERPAEETYPQPQPPGDANLTPSTSVPDYVPTQGEQSGCASRTAGTSVLVALVCLAGAGLYLAIKGRENL